MPLIILHRKCSITSNLKSTSVSWFLEEQLEVALQIENYAYHKTVHEISNFQPAIKAFSLKNQNNRNNIKINIFIIQQWIVILLRCEYFKIVVNVCIVRMIPSNTAKVWNIHKQPLETFYVENSIRLHLQVITLRRSMFLISDAR